MKLATLDDLFTLHLRELYNMESQLIDALPVFADQAKLTELVSALQEHLKITKEHADRLRKLVKDRNINLDDVTDDGIKHILSSGAKLMEDADNEMISDLILIGGGQKLEHYEMAAYQSAILLAQKLELGSSVIDSLQQSHDEEVDASTLLRTIAENS